MRALPLFLIVGLLVAPAHAAMVPNPELATLLPDSVPRVMVVVLPPSPVARQAERDLGEALRATGRAQLVFPSSALGTLSDLGTKGIEERAYHVLKLGVGAVVIGRLADNGELSLTSMFEDGAHHGPVVLVNIKAAYTEEVAKPSPPPRAAETPVAQPQLIAAAGPLAPHPPASSPERASPSLEPPTPPPSLAPPQPRRSRAEAQAEYEERAIGFHELKSVRKTEPYEGRYQRFLDWPELYTKVDLPDLAASAHTRRTWRKALLAVGVIASVGGTVGLIGQSATNTACNLIADPHCGSSAGLAVGGVLLGIGVAGIIGGSLISEEMIPAWDARRVGADYNWRLKRDLGLLNNN